MTRTCCPNNIKSVLFILCNLFLVTACKLTENSIDADNSDSTRDLDNTPPVVSFSITPQINISNQLNYMLSGTCTEDDLPVQITVGGVNLYTTCVNGLWAASGDVSIVADDPNLYIAVTQDDAANNTATHSARVLKDTVAPTAVISSSTSALSVNGGTLDVQVLLSEPVSRNDADVAIHGERTFLTSSIDMTSVDIDTLDTNTTKEFSGFYLSSAQNTVTLVTNYSSSDPSTIYFRDVAGNKLLANSNTLIFAEIPCGPSNHDTLFAGGNGSAASPYEVQTLTQFNSIRDGASCKYKLMNNIDASATATWNSGLGFESMNLTAGGEIDGNNFTVSHLTINRPTQDSVSVFASMAGTIKSITFDQIQITGRNYIAFIISIESGGFLDNVTLSNTTVAADYYVGGLAREAQSGSTLSNITLNNITVSALQYAAGFLFRNYALVSNVTANNINVSGDHYIGGLFFENYSAVTNVSASQLNVSGDNYLSGISFSNDANMTNLTATNITVTGSHYLSGAFFEITNGTLNNTVITNSTIVGDHYVSGYGFDIRSGVNINKLFVDFNITSISYGAGFAYESKGTLKEVAVFSKMNSGSCVATRFTDGSLEDAYFVCSGTPNRTIYELTSPATLNRVYLRGPKNSETLSSNGYFVDSISSGVTVQNTFFNSDYFSSPYQSNSSGSVSIVAKTSAELQNQSTYTGWNFTSVWAISAGPQPYPYLRFHTE